MPRITIQESEAVCANCRHYSIHCIMGREYIGGYDIVNCGACGYRNIKHRKPGETCVKWEAKADGKKAAS